MEHTHLISESLDEQDQTLGSSSKAGPGLSRLQAGSYKQHSDGSNAMPAALGCCSGAWASLGALADLLNTFLPALIDLLLRSVWHGSVPHLGEVM